MAESNERPKSWFGGHLAALQASLHNAEERMFGLGGNTSGEDASGYSAPALDIPAHTLSGFLRPAEAEVPLEPYKIELEERLSAFLVRVESRKTIHEKWFGGDLTMRRLFEVVHLRLRDLGKLCLRGSRERLAVANQILMPELNLKACPQYSILYEPDATREMVFLKRLYSGWCVKIDKATFEGLAYGSLDLPEKAFEKLHSLIARGPVFRKGFFPPSLRVNLVVSCDNDTHLEREQAYKERLQESEQRIEENAKRIGVVGSGPEPPEITVISGAPLLETEFVFDPETTKSSSRKQNKIIYTCSEAAVAECVEHALSAFL